MELQSVNFSFEDVSEGYAERGNLSMEVPDYNISGNGSVAQRPPVRVKGKMTSLPFLHSLMRRSLKCIQHYFLKKVLKANLFFLFCHKIILLLLFSKYLVKLHFFQNKAPYGAK